MKTNEFRNKKPLAVLLRYFKNHKMLFALDICCAVAIAAVDLAFPLVTRNVLYNILPNQKLYGVFFTIIAVCLGAYILRSLLSYAVTYYGHIFGVRVEADIRADLFRHLQEMSFEFFDRNRTGKLMSRLTSDLFEITELAHHGPEDLLTSSLTIVGALIVMSRICWQLALVVAVLIPVFLCVIVSMRGKLMTVSATVKEKTGHINAEIESSLSGIRTAKAFANEDMEQARFAAANDMFKSSKRGYYRAMALFSSTMELFLSSLNVVVIGVGGYMIMKNKLDYRDLVTFTLYVGTFVNPMRKLAAFSEMFASGFAGLKRFTDVMSQDPAIRDRDGAKDLKNVRGEIDVDHVTFAYDGDLAVLNDVTLHVDAGETVAIVGPSGGGKSTLCQLIPRFYDTSSGRILIDGQDIRDVTQKSIHENIGIVQQEVFLFADTIYENIRYGKPDATAEEVMEAARKAEIYDEIMEMPAGFETYVGERGALLSGGQKQRIAIARIFLKNPPVLILDEATSALDSITEAKIQSAFDALSEGRTTLIIAHRLSTIRSASRILSIADGEIKESGTHEQLMKNDGVYAGLYKTQNYGRI